MIPRNEFGNTIKTGISNKHYFVNNNNTKVQY